MGLPEVVVDVVETVLDTRVLNSTNLIGGQVSPVARVDTAEGSYVVKWRFGGAFGPFYQEAHGLEALGTAGRLRVPQVIATNHFEPNAGEPSFEYILMEYVPSERPHNISEFSRRFASGLAGLHRAIEDAKTLFGLDADNFLGSQPQRNRPRTSDWSSFYRDNRLLPQIDRGREAGLVPPARERSLLRVIDRLDHLLNGLPAEVSLIHGDLWSGNFLCASGDEPVLIDPAIYYAPREIEIAYIELFGGFPPKFIDNYNTVYPLDSEYLRRRSLHQLYPLLIHLNHFGEEYGPAIDRVCAEYT